MVDMLSGRETLAYLNNSLQGARKDMDQLGRALESASNEIAINRRAQAETMKRLAKLRLDALTSGQVRENLDGADFRVGELLQERSSAMAILRDKVEKVEADLDALERKRDDQHEVVDREAKVLAEREAAVQADLEIDEAFQAQLDATRAADAIAVSAQDKAQLAQKDMQTKGAPYAGDELFNYLWSRGYGTSKYSAGPLTRLLDGWVARLCGFEKARQNYWMLLEIPKRLEAHAERVQDLAEFELEKLQSLENTAAENGGVRAASDRLANAEKIQDEIDHEILNQEQLMHSLRTELDGFAIGEDRYTLQCLQLLAEAMNRQELGRLTNMATSTLTQEDDALIDDLRQLRNEDTRLQTELSQQRDMQNEQRRRQQELENVRAKFKKNRYDDLRSTFDQGDLLVMMMKKVLGGALNGGALWDAIRRYQRYQDVGGAWPDFGSGGINRRSRRSAGNRPTWHWPGPSSSGRRRGGFRLPPASRGGRSSRSRGGFRTGGGF